MISFEEGYAQIRALASPLGVERVALTEAHGRVLREDLVAARPHPALNISAMDGYALAGEAAQYRVIGEIPAGTHFDGELQSGEALRIFTGAPTPLGADRILIQENAIADQDFVRTDPMPATGENIRKMGGDFDAGFTLPSPRYLTAADLALIAAMNFAEISVSAIPRVAILATGSELVTAGKAKSPFDVIASNAYGIKALAESYGAQAEILPIIEDTPEKITACFRGLQDYDLIVSTGGASVGKYDYVKSSAEAAGFTINLHKIALRPGKPIMAGKRGEQLFIGLPGNPVSALVCASLFMRAVIHKLVGRSGDLPRMQSAVLQNDIGDNGDRTQFLRAHIEDVETGFSAQVFGNQDSAALSYLARTNAFVVREPHAPRAARGDRVKFIALRS